MGAASASLFGQSPWTQQTSPTTADLHAVCYSGQQWVAVGASGTILTSPDAKTWTSQSSGTTADLNAITTGNPGLIAVGDNETILTSPDGVTWTTVKSGGPALNAIAFPSSSGFCLAFGDQGTVLRSPTSGATWATATTGTTGSIRGVTDGYELAVGDNGLVLGTFDGIHFNVLPPATSGNLLGIVDVDATEVAVGEGGLVLTSSDGFSLAWTINSVPTNESLYAIADDSASSPIASSYPSSQVIAVGAAGTILIGRVFTSGSPLQWTSVPSGVTTDLLGIAAIRDPFANELTSVNAVAVGRGGTILTAPAGLAAPIIGDITGSEGASGDAYSDQNVITTVQGQSAQLTAAVTGVGTLAYQWYFQGQPIAGATTATLTIPSVAVANAGAYSVSVSNAYGSATVALTLQTSYLPHLMGLVDESFQPGAVSSGFEVLPNGAVIATTSTGETYLNADGTPNAAGTAAVSGLASIQSLGEPDGKVIIIGSLGAPSMFAKSVRLNADGSVDATWNPITVAGSSGPFQPALPYLALPNGQFLSLVEGMGGTILVRLNADGGWDSTYQPLLLGTTGLQAVAVTPASVQGQLAYDPSGIQLLTDSVSQIPYLLDQNSAWILNPNGTLQTLAPTVQLATPSVLPTPYLYFPQTIWYSVRGGNFLYQAITPFPPGMQLYDAGRLTPSGQPDPNYPAIQRADYGGSVYGPDGSLYLVATGQVRGPGIYSWWTPGGGGSYPSIDGTYRAGIVRYDPNGNFDPAFSFNFVSPGLQTMPGEYINGMAFAPNGQLYLSGDFTEFNGEPHVGLVRVNLGPITQTDYLANLSARGGVMENSAMIGGFVIGNSGTKQLLVRGVGPALAAFGVTRPLPDPQLTLNAANGAELQQVGAWSSQADASVIAAVASQVFAFALPNPSPDAALVASLSNGTYTFSVQGASGDSGTVLAELYDADAQPIPFASPRLVNLSARCEVSATSPLVGGFVVGGTNTERLLIRAVGPTLAQFGVTDPLPDPVLELFQGTTPIAQVQGGPGGGMEAVTATAVGAFALPATGKDDAIVITVPPGDYTAQVTSASGASGQALVEVYVVP